MSESFAFPGAVPPPEGFPDAGVPWHYGDPHGEQRRLAIGRARVDLSHRGVIRVSGPDRLGWLHSLSTQHLERLVPGGSTVTLFLSPHGHVEQEAHVVDDGESTWLIVDASSITGLMEYLQSMRFMLRVEIEDVTDEWAVVGDGVHEVLDGTLTWLAPSEFAGLSGSDAGSDRGGDAGRYLAAAYLDQRPEVFAVREILVPRSELLAHLGADPAGTWAWEALRVAAAVPRAGFETDHRTLPHEVGWVGPAVHLAKGCYRGQEAVARVHNLGHPPRRLVLLHLDGGAEILPAHGDPVFLGERQIGWIGSAARHFELGPIATAVVKRTAPEGEDLMVRAAEGEIAAAQEVVIRG
jgi:tRNA-modifying protein YgfZ